MPPKLTLAHSKNKVLNAIGFDPVTREVDPRVQALIDQMAQERMAQMDAKRKKIMDEVSALNPDEEVLFPEREAGLVPATPEPAMDAVAPTLDVLASTPERRPESEAPADVKKASSGARKRALPVDDQPYMQREEFAAALAEAAAEDAKDVSDDDRPIVELTAVQDFVAGEALVAAEAKKEKDRVRKAKSRAAAKSGQTSAQKESRAIEVQAAKISAGKKSGRARREAAGMPTPEEPSGRPRPGLARQRRLLEEQALNFARNRRGSEGAFEPPLERRARSQYEPVVLGSGSRSSGYDARPGNQAYERYMEAQVEDFGDLEVPDFTPPYHVRRAQIDAASTGSFVPPPRTAWLGM